MRINGTRHIMNDLVNKHETTLLVIVFLIVLLSRLLLVFAVQSYKTTRDWESGQIARNVLNGNGYSAGPGWIAKANLPTAHKPPLYPAFLLAVFYAFPDEWTPIMPDNLAKKSHLTVQIIQSVVFSL